MPKPTGTIMEGVREYEGPIYLDTSQGGRIVVVAYNEGGFNRTEVDLLDLIGWVQKHRPELLRSLAPSTP